MKVSNLIDVSARFVVPAKMESHHRSSHENGVLHSRARADQSSIHHSVLLVLLLAWFPLTSGVAMRASAAETREVHGMADAFATSGVAIAWGVVRGASEPATLIAIRVVADAPLYPWISVAGSDPFTNQHHQLLRPMSNAGLVDVRLPRSSFADFPRTELRFYATAAEAQSDLPKLTVFYLGVPDTTPEFATEERLETYLTNRMARLHGDGGSKAP